MVQRQSGGWLTLFLGLFSALLGLAPAASPPPQTFATWDLFEADKCASIWLIKRHIAPQAQIVFFSRDETPPPGVLFDTPEAEFRRYHNRSTFETLLDHYGLNDQRLIHIGRIIHDIEVNIWERKVMEETPKVKFEVFEILDDERPEKTVAACIEYFDAFYERLP